MFFYDTLIFSFSFHMQYRQFVSVLPSVSGNLRATVVTKRITRRQCKQTRVTEKEREREDEDILNGKLNNFEHFIKAQTSYLPLLFPLRLSTILLQLSNYRVCHKFPLNS